MAIQHGKRVLNNTLMLYARQIIVLMVTLYSFRVLLQVLGVDGFGIYNVIAGIVTLMTFFSGTMASATQRYFSFALGRRDIEALRKIYSTNMLIYGAILLCCVVCLETFGVFFVNTWLKLPEGALMTIKWVYQFTVVVFVFTIVTTPFIAIVMAHEDMGVYASISVCEAALKLASVFILKYIPGEKMIMYSVMLSFISIAVAICYVSFCIKHYAECQLSKLCWDKKLLKEILGFTGWTLYGQITTVSRYQGVTILLNQIFTPTVVAARSIAVNVANQCNMFAVNFSTGIYPPIVKSYAAGDFEDMVSFVFNGSKATFFLMWVFGLPLSLSLEYILKLWLVVPPPEALLFTRLSLIEVLILAISLPLTAAARAPGKMRVYELSLGTMQILGFIISLLLVSNEQPAVSVFIVAIVLNISMMIVRILIVQSLTVINIKAYVKDVLIPIVLVVTVSLMISWEMKKAMPAGFIYEVIFFVSSVIATTLSFYFLGIDRIWREKIFDVFLKKIRSFT